MGKSVGFFVIKESPMPALPIRRLRNCAATSVIANNVEILLTLQYLQAKTSKTLVHMKKSYIFKLGTAKSFRLHSQDQKHLFSASAEAPKIAKNGHFLAFSAENGYIFGNNFCIIFRTFAHKNELCVSIFTECEVPVLKFLHSASKVPAALEQSRVWRNVNQLSSRGIQQQANTAA